MQEPWVALQKGQCGPQEKRQTYADFAEGDARVDVALEQMLQEVHDNATFGALVCRMSSAGGNLVATHVILDIPLALEDETVNLKFACNAAFASVKRNFTKEQAVECDAKGPDVDGFCDRLGWPAGFFVVYYRVVDDLGGHEHGGAGFYCKIGVVEEKGIFGILRGGAHAEVGQALRIGEVGGAKVGNLDMRTIFCPEEIGGLDVAVDDALGVYCSDKLVGGA